MPHALQFSPSSQPSSWALEGGKFSWRNFAKRGLVRDFFFLAINVLQTLQMQTQTIVNTHSNILSSFTSHLLQMSAHHLFPQAVGRRRSSDVVSLNHSFVCTNREMPVKIFVRASLIHVLFFFSFLPFLSDSPSFTDPSLSQDATCTVCFILVSFSFYWKCHVFLTTCHMHRIDPLPSCSFCRLWVKIKSSWQDRRCEDRKTSPGWRCATKWTSDL